MAGRLGGRGTRRAPRHVSRRRERSAPWETDELTALVRRLSHYDENDPSGAAADLLGKIQVVTWRGMMTKLMLAVYEVEGASRGRADGWQMNAMVVDVRLSIPGRRILLTLLSPGRLVSRRSQVSHKDRVQSGVRIVLQASVLLRLLFRSVLDYGALSLLPAGLLSSQHERSVVQRRQDEPRRLSSHRRRRSRLRLACGRYVQHHHERLYRAQNKHYHQQSSR